MSSKATKKKEDSFDLEQQFILRLPPGPSIALRRDVQAGALSLKDKLTIEINHDKKKSVVRYGGQVFTSKLVDLPCLVESLKTTDQKTFYKTADISQMLMCLTEEEAAKEDKSSPRKKEKDKRQVIIHGLTPPMKNVKRRRFRKTLKKRNIEERPDIEKEVRRLFRMDSEAIDIRWELITEDERPLLDRTNASPQAAEPSPGRSSTPRGLTGDKEIAEHEIFGELSTDEDEKEVNVLDNSEDDTTQAMLDGPSRFTDQDSQASMSALFPGATQSDGDAVENELEAIKNELGALKQKRKSKESAIQTIDNEELKQKLEDELENIKVKENEKQKEYDIFSSMLGRR